jgi:hypothetical protein
MRSAAHARRLRQVLRRADLAVLAVALAGRTPGTCIVTGTGTLASRATAATTFVWTVSPPGS